MMAEKWRLKRAELDDFAYQSHMRAMHAIQSGRFEGQILPIQRPDGRLVTTDEGVRMPPDREKMASLKPVFKADGVVTAGNASQISDGAAAVLLASPKAVGRYNLSPIARLVARSVLGSDPVLMLDGPIPATRQVLKRAGLSLDEIDVIEINEAFATVVLAWAKELGVMDLSRVNPNGGAIALGHPLGATGAILMTKLIHELQRSGGRYGLQTMCIGHGMATATVVERL
jgi:acetyl-CoA acyltransferase